MPYDASLDNALTTKTHENENGCLSVNVYSYNNGPRKLQISRQTKDREGNLKFAKLGRLSKDEIEAILPLINEVLEQLD